MKKAFIFTLAILCVTQMAFATDGGLTGIINPNQGQSGQQLTIQQKQSRMFLMFKARSTSEFNNVLNTFKWGWNQVWNNPDGLTPQQAFDGMVDTQGNKLAVQSLMASNLTVQYINSMIPGTIPVDANGTPITPKPLAINQDGSVTVGA